MRRRWANDFEEFVAARWPDLARTAYLVCGDAASAREVTAAALDDLGAHWRRAADEGTPGALAHRAVLRHLERLETGRGGWAPADDDRPAAPGDRTDPLPATAGPGRDGSAERRARVLAELLDAYAALPVTARSVVALEHVEGLRPEEAAHTLDLPVDEVLSAVERARTDLAAADGAARTRHGLTPDPGALAGDLADALQGRAEGADLTGDPLALVTARRRARRRHTARVALGVAGTGALVVGGLAVLTATDSGTPASSRPPATASTTVWVDASRWPARGGLASDVEVRRVVARDWGVTTRLLYAGVFDGSRIVVGWQPSQGTDNSQIKVLAGPAGQPLSAVVSRSFDTHDTPQALAVLGVPTGTSVPLLVLGRPGVARVETSTRVSYGSSGQVVHHWAGSPLQEGVGELELPVAVVPGQPLLPALRVRLEGHDGPAINQGVPDLQITVPACPGCTRAAWAAATTAETVARISAATGVDEVAVTTSTLALGTVRRLELPAPAAAKPVLGEGDLACTLYRLPDGTTLTSSALRIRSGGPSPRGGPSTWSPAAGRHDAHACRSSR